MSASFQKKEDANRRGYACRQLFNRKGVLREGGSCWKIVLLKDNLIFCVC